MGKERPSLFRPKAHITILSPPLSKLKLLILWLSASDSRTLLRLGLQTRQITSQWLWWWERTRCRSIIVLFSALITLSLIIKEGIIITIAIFKAPSTSFLVAPAQFSTTARYLWWEIKGVTYTGR